MKSLQGRHMRNYVKRQILLFGFVASCLSFLAQMIGLYFATYTFFRAYPASLADQSESIGIILSEIAPYGALASSLVIGSLAVLWRIRVPSRVLRGEVMNYLSAQDSLASAQDLLSEIDNEIRG